MLNVQNVSDILDNIILAEQTVSEYYKVCNEKFPTHADLWSALEKVELQHVENVKKMKQLFLSNPDKYVQGRAFNPMGIKTFIDAVRKNIDLFSSSNVTCLNALCVARDFEQSIIENKYSEILATKDVEYNLLVTQLVKDTAAHKALLNNKIQENMGG